MKYTGINIGPIVETLSLARRPRELWSASYMFSYLMQCIINEIPIDNSVEIISPARLSTEHDKKVGLYPDRVFVKGEINVEAITKEALKKFAENTGVEQACNYFNVMSLSVEYSNDAEAIKELNCFLDIAELCKRPVDDDAMLSVIKLITKKQDSPLFGIAFDKKEFEIPSLNEIATYSLSREQEWKEICKEQEQDAFYKEIKKRFPTKYRTYHKYVCIVQADGDNMGCVVSNPQNRMINELSAALLNFGTEACKKIRAFGGLPIYAGGDDLLFIAPVVSNAEGYNIFNLLSELDTCYDTVKTRVKEMSLVDLEGKEIATSMSYGLSINYYKYPLYEALESARNLLFRKAKKIDGKDAIAWMLQKHSGSSFSGTLSKTESEVYSSFLSLIENTADEKTVAAVAHKMRENKTLFSLLVDKDEDYIKIRLEALFCKIMDTEGKSEESKRYLCSIECLLLQLYKELKYMEIKKEDGETNEADTEIIRKKKTEWLVQNAYGMLRTAKFIKGEEDEYE